MKGILRLATVVIIAGLVVTACTTAASPTPAPTAEPSAAPSAAPTAEPSAAPTAEPTPTPAPTLDPNGLLAKVIAAGKLRVSTDPNYKPFSYLDPDIQVYVGFDIAVAEETARRLSTEVGKEIAIEWVTPDWAVITAGNWGGRWDISIGSMSVTKTRAKVVDFVDPYFFDFGSVAVPTNSAVQSLAELDGKKFCVGAATTYQQWLEGTLEIVDPTMVTPPANVTIVPLKTDNECVQAVKAGRTDIDAIAANANVLADAEASGMPVRVLAGPPTFTVSVAFALDKSGPPTADMLKVLNKVVADMHADGTLRELSMKWLKKDVTKPPQ